MYELVRQILEAERIPEEWKETVIVPIHKTGDREVQGNSTGKCSLQNLVKYNIGKN